MSKIIVIEDDHDFASILVECLEEDASLQVVATLSSLAEATSWLSERRLDGIDCVLVDLMLPISSMAKEVNSRHGLRLVQEIRHTHQFLGRIVVLTNSHDLSDGERALYAGCDAYMCKHAPPSEMDEMMSELKMALQGDVVLIPKQMRHVFMRQELSVKEAKLMEMVNAGHSWQEIADVLGYKTAKAAANIGYRVFEKLLTEADRRSLGSEGDHKRDLALLRWRASTGHHEASEAAPP